jgi:DNA-binding response OmpR family regulator
MNRTILLVEDHEKTCDLIKSVLKRERFRFVCAKTLRDGKSYLKEHKPALIILDLVLPDGNGLELCALVRSSQELSKTPIIALTGLTEFSDKKRGFEAGVDQYLEKPIVLDELSLWVKALLRRVDWNSHGGPIQTCGDLQICAESYVVRFQEQAIGNLTRREFDLFYYLVQNSPKIISRDVIISEVWKTASVENLVDTHIFNLRQKLPRELAARVQSVSGKGFRYFPNA